MEETLFTLEQLAELTIEFVTQEELDEMSRSSCLLVQKRIRQL